MLFLKFLFFLIWLALRPRKVRSIFRNLPTKIQQKHLNKKFKKILENSSLSLNYVDKTHKNFTCDYLLGSLIFIMKYFNIAINNIILFSLLTLQLLESEEGTICVTFLQKLSDLHVSDGSLTHNPKITEAISPWCVTLYLTVKHVSVSDGHITLCIAWPGIVITWESTKNFPPVVHLIPYPRKNKNNRELYQYLGLFQ